MYFEKGKEYIVISDIVNKFRLGDIVVSLEDGTPFAQCCDKKDYDINSPIDSYNKCYLSYNEVVRFKSNEQYRRICEILMLDKMRDIVNIAKVYDPTTEYLNVSLCNNVIAINNDYWNNRKEIERHEVF